MKHNACVCFKPNTRNEAQELIRSTHGTNFKIKNKCCYETTVPVQTKADKECSNELYDFSIDRLKVAQIDTSQHGYAEVSNEEEMRNKNRHTKKQQKRLNNYQIMKQ